MTVVNGYLHSMGLRGVKAELVGQLTAPGPLVEQRLSPGSAELFALAGNLPEPLITPEIERILTSLAAMPQARVLKALFSLLCRPEPFLHWRAVEVMGPLVARVGDGDMEAARVVMRRFMWSLNDESGGIGWGAPEAMAESLVHNDTLADEYSHILVSFMREDGFYLEYPPLQRGLMWGLGRLAAQRPALLREKRAIGHLLPYLASPDPEVRGLAARVAGLLDAREAVESLEKLQPQNDLLTLYHHNRLLTLSVGLMASAVLEKLR